MRSRYKALLFAAVFANVAAVQRVGGSSADQAAKTAVVAFTPSAEASGMTDNAKRWLQSQLSATLHRTHKFDVYDTRHTRRASQDMLSAINHDSSTAPAVKLGKQLGVTFVLTGMVTQYVPKGEGDFGYATVRTRLIEVATGKIRHSSELAQKGTSKMYNGGEAEMQARVMKPLIDSLTAALRSAI